MLIGLLIGVALTLAYTCLYIMGIFMGVMGTDSCHGVDGGPIVFLFFGWPLLLLGAAWTPSILFWCKIRWPWVLATAILMGLGSIGSYIIYPIWLGYACH